MKRHVEWEPLNGDGTQWIASCDGLHRGEAVRIYGGRYYARIAGRSKGQYATTLREVAKYLVAFVNSVPPSSL